MVQYKRTRDALLWRLGNLGERRSLEDGRAWENVRLPLSRRVVLTKRSLSKEWAHNG